MNLVDHPELADRLAAAYGLGTLRGGARRRFEAQAKRSPALRAAALAWQERFAGLTELQARQVPSPNVWKRIEIELANEARPVETPSESPSSYWTRAVRLWRGVAGGCALATIVMIGVTVYLSGEVGLRDSQLAQTDRARETLARQNVQLAARLQAQPSIQFVAVLADDRSAATVLATFDATHGTLTLKRLGAYQEGPGKSLQLWALPPGGKPRSLGVLGGEPVVKLTAAESDFRQVRALAISLEPEGGVPSQGGPTGPVLFKGPLLQTP